jgi:hypothetical protein
MLRRALAFTLALGILAVFPPPTVRAEPGVEAGAAVPEYLAPAPPPAKYAKLTWVFETTRSPGYWYTATQVVAIDRRIDFLERACSQAQVDAKIATAKATMPAWVWIVSGAVVGAGATWATMRVVK